MGTPTIIPHDRITAQRRTLRIAWLTLFVFFALFLTIVTMVVLSLRQWYLTVTDAHQAVLIVRSSNESIVWQPAGARSFRGRAISKS